MPNYYPVMLDVRGRLVLVIGGGRMAAEKAAALAACGAQVRVLSEEFCPEMLALAEEGRVVLVRKVYEAGDAAGAFVVVAATSDSHLIEEIWEETQKRGQLVNVVDVPTRCSFIVPSILRREQLTIAVSTEGASPGLAKRIRQRLEEMFPDAYGVYLRLAAATRVRLREQGVSYERRDDFFGDYFTSDALALLVDGDVRQATEVTAALLAQYGVFVAAGDLVDAIQRPSVLPGWRRDDRPEDGVSAAASQQEM